MSKEADEIYKRTIDIYKKCANNNIEIKQVEKDRDGVIKKEIYGMNVEFHVFDKERFKNRISEAQKSGELFKAFGVTDLNDEEFLEYLNSDHTFINEVDERVWDIKKAQIESIFSYIEKEFARGNSEKDKSKLKTFRTNTADLAYLLIKRALSSEENMNSFACRIYDNKHSFWCGGDTELPFEIQFIDDGKELVCDVYIDAHHVSFTSNSPLLLANAKSDSLAEGKILIRITSANGDNEKKYKSVEDLKRYLIGIERLTTADGKIKINNINGELHFLCTIIAEKDRETADAYRLKLRKYKPGTDEFNEYFSIVEKYLSLSGEGRTAKELEEYFYINAYAKQDILIKAINRFGVSSQSNDQFR